MHDSWATLFRKILFPDAYTKRISTLWHIWLWSVIKLLKLCNRLPWESRRHNMSPQHSSWSQLSWWLFKSYISKYFGGLFWLGYKITTYCVSALFPLDHLHFIQIGHILFHSRWVNLGGYFLFIFFLNIWLFSDPLSRHNEIYTPLVYRILCLP